MKNITKKLLFGYVFIMLLGIGCFGFTFINFLSNPNAVVIATCVSSFLLLGAYLVITFINLRKNLSQRVQNRKLFLILLIILSLITVALTMLFFMFHSSILTFYSENPKILRLTISLLFVISMMILVLLWFKNRKKTRRSITPNKIKPSYISFLKAFPMPLHPFLLFPVVRRLRSMQTRRQSPVRVL